jgi:hypothetical protein
MGKQKSNQSGFGTVEVLLVFVIVAVIGFVGWYILRSKNASTTGSNNAASSPTNTKPKAETISFNENKLPVDWTHLTAQDGTLYLNYSGSESAGSSVTLKKTIDTTVKAADEAKFVEAHRQKAGNATTTDYGRVLLPPRKVSIATVGGTKAFTGYVYEIRDYKNSLLSTHVEIYIVRDGYYVSIEEVVNGGGESLPFADKSLDAITLNI